MSKSLFGAGVSADASTEPADDCWLCAGIGADDTGEDYLSVWIETSPKHRGKAAFKERVRLLAPKLRKRNPGWKFRSQEADTGWASRLDAELSVPLATVLIADDQQKAVCEFVTAALQDLKAAGVLDAFHETIGRAAARRK